MKKIDLHQDVILSFEGQIDSFEDGSNHIDKSGRFSGALPEYLDAELSIFFSAIWPYEIDEHYVSGDIVSSSYIRYKALYSSLIELAKRNNIGIIKAKNDAILSDVPSMLLHVEGLDFLENVDQFSTLITDGIRSAGFVWKYDNALCGCSFSDKDVTKLGAECVEFANIHGCIVDTAHMSERSMISILKLSKKPTINSHSNLLSLFENKRNVSNSFIKALAKTGGVLGLSVYDDFIVGKDRKSTIKDYLDQIEYVINLAGEESVCIGTDFHGLRKERITEGIGSISGLQQLEERVLDRFGSRIARKFFSANALRVIHANL